MPAPALERQDSGIDVHPTSANFIQQTVKLYATKLDVDAAAATAATAGRKRPAAAAIVAAAHNSFRVQLCFSFHFLNFDLALPVQPSF